MGHSGVHHQSSHSTFWPTILTDHFNIISSITIITSLLFSKIQFPHTRRSPHNVEHSSSYYDVHVRPLSSLESPGLLSKKRGLDSRLTLDLSHLLS